MTSTPPQRATRRSNSKTNCVSADAADSESKRAKLASINEETVNGHGEQQQGTVEPVPRLLPTRQMSTVLEGSEDAYTKILRSRVLTDQEDKQPVATDGFIDALERKKDSTAAAPLFDPSCDPDNPRAVTFQEISAAAFKIRGGIVRTPTDYSTLISRNLGVDIFFKKEFLQHTGSFKERGARFALMCLEKDKQKAGVIAASAGNHALALSYHGQKLGIPVTVVMPVVAPLMKISLCKTYGANVIIGGAHIGESKEQAMRMAAEQNMTYINGYDHPHILAGQGTCALEILEQVDDIDAVMIAVGGAGLIAGMAVALKYLKPSIQIYACESAKAASFQAAMEAGKPTKITVRSTLADGLAVSQVGVNAFKSCHQLVDKCITVDERYIALAILRLIENEKAVVEGGGATALACLLADKCPELRGKRVVIPLTGGNIDTTVLGRCIDRGLVVDGRMAKFEVVVSDRPGGIAELATLLAQNGASIKDMFHERAWISGDVFSVNVSGVLELRDAEHGRELEQKLLDHYHCVTFNGKRSTTHAQHSEQDTFLPNHK